MSDGADGSAGPKTPADFLRTIKGKPVVVKLNSGVDYRGEHLPKFSHKLGFLCHQRSI